MIREPAYELLADDEKLLADAVKRWSVGEWSCLMDARMWRRSWT